MRHFGLDGVGFASLIILYAPGIIVCGCAMYGGGFLFPGFRSLVCAAMCHAIS